MIKCSISFLICLLSLQGLSAQKEKDSLFLKLNLKFGTQPLQLHKTYISKNNDSLQIKVLKFYISNLQIDYNDNSFANSNSFHLIDIENLNSLRIPIGVRNNKVVTSVQFQIGIDSTASVSGALAGDLDPANGMYWAWQSGYINTKIEGTSTSCKTRKNQFQFHIGGYKKPNYAIRNCSLHPSENLEITVDVAELFSKINLKETNSIMIPGIKAMELADYCITMFKIE